MKYIILPLLTIGSIFASTNQLQPESSVETKQTYSDSKYNPTRGVTFIGAKGGLPIEIEKMNTNQPLCTEIFLSYRTPIIVDDYSNNGYAHKVTIGIDPTPLLIFQKGSRDIDLSAAYQLQYYANAKDNNSSYIGGKVFSNIELTKRSNITPGLGVVCGKEFNKKGSSLYFVETGLDFGLGTESMGYTKMTPVLCPNIKVGFGF